MNSFNLDRTLSWTKALQALNADDAATLAMLSDLQGNILKGHGRDFTAHLFLAVNKGGALKTKKLLRELADEMPSALDQLTGAQVFKATGKDAGGFLAMFLSARGYEALELQGSLPEGQAFRAGMGSRQAILSDPPSGQWESHLAGPVHAMILLADDDRNALKARTSDMRSRIESGGAATVVGVDEGIARRNDEKQGIEHFGYVDGRSQPLILEEDIDKERAAGGVDKWDPSIPLKQVLVPCPGAGLDVSHGSFFVFRKLEQDVLGFKTREIALAEELKRQSKSDPGELAGAYVVGRFENGTPTLLESHEVPVGPGATAVPNNFNYDADQAGLSCPYAAHIRKTNPRDPKIDSTSRLMARRGIIYGERKDGPNDGKLNNKPSRGVGLLFMAYQSSLENQFEFTQESWANNKGFHFASPVQPVGIDPVIGQPKSGGDQAYPLKYGVGPLSELFDFSGFVKMQGGEYFFAPSLSFFKRL